MTLPRVKIDLRAAWEYAQVYVASKCFDVQSTILVLIQESVSRATCLDGLEVLGLPDSWPTREQIIAEFMDPESWRWKNSKTEPPATTDDPLFSGTQRHDKQPPWSTR
jgi:hypothetical protein